MCAQQGIQKSTCFNQKNAAPSVQESGEDVAWCQNDQNICLVTKSIYLWCSCEKKLNHHKCPLVRINSGSDSGYVIRVNTLYKRITISDMSSSYDIVSGMILLL